MGGVTFVGSMLGWRGWSVIGGVSNGWPRRSRWLGGLGSCWRSAEVEVERFGGLRHVGGWRLGSDGLALGRRWPRRYCSTRRQVHGEAARRGVVTITADFAVISTVNFNGIGFPFTDFAFHADSYPTLLCLWYNTLAQCEILTDDFLCSIIV